MSNMSDTRGCNLADFSAYTLSLATHTIVLPHPTIYQRAKSLNAKVFVAMSHSTLNGIK